ncbi:MAG TPA: hypothetical protein VMU85_00080 [Stellaceae bacterium]|nr:hypothetical protein [Stellaceae bacterium]
MTLDAALAGAAAPRPREPDFLLRPERLAALQPSRLSASRTLMAQAIRERWKIRRIRFEIDGEARGTALYRIEAGGAVFDFPVFSFEPKRAGRTGRIIGRVWDMMAALIEGPASAEEIEQTKRELPKLYAGRAPARTLIWCRSNRSMRVFDHALESLAAGRQPDLATLGQACYLMRNTGLDGNGTFGTRSFRALEADHPLRRPLAAQMLCAYMMREFAADVADHLARQRAPATAVALAPDIRRFLGVGNGSALGLILYVNNHPHLVDRWLSAFETALAAAKSLKLAAGDPRLLHLLRLLDRAIAFRREDRMIYEAFAPSRQIAGELALLRAAVEELYRGGRLAGAAPSYPLAALADAFEDRIAPETLETLHSLLIELVPELVDRLADNISVEEEFHTTPEMTVDELRALLRQHYAWAFALDLAGESTRRYIWYKSVTAEEPRRGPREEVPWAINLGLDLPRLVQDLDAALAERAPRESTARFLLAHPEYRSFVARVQTLRALRYHSPHMNIMGEEFVPIHLVRLVNVAIHGIDKTRDFLNRNLRGVLFHGAPLPEEIAAGADPDWFYPPEPAR